MRMPGFARLSVVVFVFTLFTFAQGAWAQSIIAEDHAGNYDGENPWIDQSNGGTGFGPWNFDVDDNSDDPVEENRYYAGAFIGDPAFAGVSGFGPEAFGLYANPAGTDASVLISRDFDAELESNQVFSLQWAVNWDTDTENRKGFRIYNDDTQLLEVSMNGYPGPVEINYGNGFEDTEIEYGTGPMTWRMRMVDATTLQVTSTGRDGTPPVVYSTNITVTAAPDSFAIFTGAMSSGDERQPYYNNFVIYEGPDPEALMITGSANILIGQTNTLTLHRSAGVGNEITLSNSNPSAVNAPANVEFDPGAPTVAFDIVGLDTGSADLQAFGDVATSAVFAVMAAAMPDPPEGIYDDATYYPLGWTDGSNGGNGFEAWWFEDEGGAHLIGDATFNGADNAADLNTDDVSFALIGGPDGGYQGAGREFETALIPGDVFTFSMSFQWDGNNRGFDLLSSEGTVFNLNISEDGYDWTGDNNIPITDWPPRDQGVLIDVIITATSTGFDYSLSSDQDANIANISGSIASQPLTGFKFYNNETGDGGRFHFNKLEVIPSTDPQLFISGPSSVVEGTTNTYTLSRMGTVTNDVQLVSTNTSAMTVPGLVSFTNGASTVTFDGVAVGVGVTELRATSQDLLVESGPFPVTVTIPPEPPEGIYDEASFYSSATWTNDSNEGSGFNPWALSSSDGGTFVWAAGEQGDNSTALDTDDLSFGMWADSNGWVNARRSFQSALNPGDVFTFQMAICWDDGNRGFDLFANEVQVFNFNIHGDGYSWTGLGSAPATTWEGIRENGMILDVEITATATGFDFSITSPNDGGTLEATGSVVSDPVDEFQFYLSDAPGEGSQNNFYFNRLMVVTDDEPPEPDPDVVEVQFAVAAGEPAVLTFIGAAGVEYALQYTTDLTDPNGWTPVPGATAEGDGVDPITVQDNDPADMIRIYRLVRVE